MGNKNTAISREKRHYIGFIWGGGGGGGGHRGHPPPPPP